MLIEKGNFWMGAASGLIVTGFNHLVHKIDPPVNWFSEEDGALYEVAENDSTNNKNEVVVYAHSNENAVYMSVDKGESVRLDPEQFVSYLKDRAPEFRNFLENGGNYKITLKSCNTGAESRNGVKILKNFAKKLSGLHEGLTVVAPNGYYLADYNWFGNAYEAGIGNPGGIGKWNTYYDGKLISSKVDNYPNYVKKPHKP